RVAAPVHLHEIRPRRHPKMLPESVPVLASGTFSQPGPAANHRVLAVCSDNPAAAHFLTIHADAGLADARDPRSPAQLHAHLFGFLHENLMQFGAPNAQPAALRKIGFDLRPRTPEANALKRRGFLNRDSYSEFRQRRQTVRHDALAAGFVNRRPRAIRHHHLKARRTRRNCRGQTRRSASHDKHFRIQLLSALYHFNSTNSEQNPGPMAASTLSVPGSGRRCAITSSSTSSTDAEDRFPTFFRQHHEASRAPSGSSSASLIASSTAGPPVCMIQVPISPRSTPFSPRNSSTSLRRCRCTISGTSRDSTIRKPFSEMSHPITSSVLG